MEPRKNKKPANKTKKTSRWHTFGQWMLWLLTLISVAGLLLACFGGNFHPADFKYASIMILSMPIWIILTVISTVLDIIWCRRAIPFCLLAFIACASAIWDYSPLNLSSPSAAKYAKCHKFTLLTYNIASFHDMNDEYPGGVNPTVSYIIKTNADVVCLQETEVTLSSPFERFHITAAQIDSINKLYPYRLVYGDFLTLLSKYPAESIHTPALNNDSSHKWRYYPIGVFRLNIEGVPITLFNVHLQSYGLSDSDKTLYKNIATGEDFAEVAEGSVKENLHEIKSEILQKVQNAAVQRAADAEALCNYIAKFGGPNVIVAGDFNDVPGCYTLRRLADCKLHEVYPKLGFGPMITFNADKFYFRIDHVLYRGDLVPLNISRGNLKSSDHYPLLTTFAIVPSNE